MGKYDLADSLHGRLGINWERKRQRTSDRVTSTTSLNYQDGPFHIQYYQRQRYHATASCNARVIFCTIKPLIMIFSLPTLVGILTSITVTSPSHHITSQQITSLPTQIPSTPYPSHVSIMRLNRQHHLAELYLSIPERRNLIYLFIDLSIHISVMAIIHTFSPTTHPARESRY
jgi:hypothetical protein